MENKFFVDGAYLSPEALAKKHEIEKKSCCTQKPYGIFAGYGNYKI